MNLVREWWKTQKIQERGHESKLSHCVHRRNIQLWNKNENKESKREQRRGYCQLPQTPVFR
ncbi:hypothetical protein E2C01_095640 [Portunus trituberculatus]|uniref:Uncharacterized protein n=1 Tax=Portunus trituberculatus TaxID=210409 RepID=A0A5B7K0N4_PORTR|nr:hypothetical protein [Portunus trituberculatus]